MNFVNALEKIPGIIAQYEERTAKHKADVPQLETIIAKQIGEISEKSMTVISGYRSVRP
jgi:hypothetical protein